MGFAEEMSFFFEVGELLKGNSDFEHGKLVIFDCRCGARQMVQFGKKVCDLGSHCKTNRIDQG